MMLQPIKTYHTDQKRSTPLTQAVRYLMQKLRKATQWRFTLYNTGDFKQTPSSVRGNASYAYFQSFRLEDIQRQITCMLCTDGRTYTNMLFQTLTLRYDPEDPADVERVWREGTEAIARFTRKMKKLFMVDYCLGIESFEQAGFHLHLVAILDRTVEMKKHVVWVKGKKRITYRLTDLTFLSRIREAWAKATKKPLHEAQIDVQCCYSHGFAGYIVKELKKASCVETALKHYRQGEDTAADRKKILAFYMADKLKIRLLRVSRGLSSAKPEEEGQLPNDNDLIPIRNNSTGGLDPEKPIPLFSILLNRKQLFQVVDFKTFEPWTGTISPEAPHYQKIMEFFNERFNVFELFEDKERLKQLVEHKKREIEEKELNKQKTFALAAVALSL